ncbi:T9SS type A sorting domain-containing protein [Polluticoccus soli]|uniref:T9SS type A sorting domain-containing protein n=1 Tax=Polluticoccus soli TaxID=3034150 RepID=UPI0023E2D28A|nr:T9SS type A sorting domain-containing protein [Flavipsychrobacter sp. JY13-12]
MIRTLLAICLILQVPATYAQQFRLKKLVRSTMYNETGMTEDYTMNYYYSSDKPGPFTAKWAGIGHNPFPFNLSGTLLYDSAIQTNKNMSASPIAEYIYQTINAQNQITKRETYDKADATTPLTLFISQIFTFSGTSLISQTNNDDLYTYVYKNGKLDTSYYYPLGASTPLYFNVYSYNTNGDITSTKSYNSAGVSDLQRYYTGPNVTDAVTLYTTYSTSVTDTTFRSIYTYNAQNEVVTSENWNCATPGTDLILRNQNFNTYDANNNILESLLKTERNGLPGLDTTRNSTYTYNTWGQLTKVETLNWDGTQFKPMSDTSDASSSQKIEMEYELYWPASVHELNNDAQVKLYPSPASDFIRVETEWKQATPFTAAILDMQGRVIRQWDEPATKVYTRSIPLTELPSGMYMIKLHCGEEQFSKQFSVYK